MKQKNYTKFSERFKKSEGEKVVEEIKEKIENEVENELFTEIINDENVKKLDTSVEVSYIKEGKVVGCEKLNLREKPAKDAKVLCVLNKGDKVQVDLKIDGEPQISNTSFYQVCTAAGVKGYCMTKFISIE